MAGVSTTETTNAPIPINETERLIASDKVGGTAVNNRQGGRLGEVYNFMVDKLTGQVAYAVMGFDGFLGIGERYHPLPWKTLAYDTRLGGFVIDLTRDQLERAPSYTLEETPWAGPKYGRSVHDYYDIP